jgi:phosphoribosylformylglycinamidine (FGAM) synthase-like enzyme
LVDAPAGARMAVAESITNLVFARISEILVINFYLFIYGLFNIAFISSDYVLG